MDSTDDSSVIDSLNTYITDLKIEKYKDQYVLSFEESELPVLPIKDFKFLDQSSFILNIPDIGSNNIEFQFNFIPKFRKKLIWQIAYSLGSYNSDNIYRITEYSIGIGRVFNISTGNLHLIFNYSRTNRDKISRGSYWYPEEYHMNTSSQTRLFVTLYYKKRFFADQLVATLGVRYNYSDVSIKKSNNKLGIDVGIGKIFN